MLCSDNKTYILTLLLFALFASGASGAAFARDSSSATDDPCKSEWQGKLDENGYEIELCYDQFDFDNYSYRFSLPEKRIGYPYPARGMAHGVVFPLGPLRKEEERRELLVWAHYDMAEDEDMNSVPLEKQLQENLASFAEKRPEALTRAVFSQEQQDNVDFLCYSTDDGEIFSRECLGLFAGTIYEFSLLSTPEHVEKDLRYFEEVFKTFTITYITEGRP